MTKQTLSIGNIRVDVLIDADNFLGLGAIYIGDTQVRSGRLPIRPRTQTFKGGLEIGSLKLVKTEAGKNEIRLKLEATFRPLAVQMMRDHSFDPIHDTGDWDSPRDAGKGTFDLVIKPASETFINQRFDGFSYHYEYSSDNVPIFYILDQASWELDGNIEGATVYSQSSCSDPVATFARDTKWTTEGVMHWADENSVANLVMTHNLPRWASHGSFDFQFKGDKTLIGVFERVDLIRSLLKRESGKAELKTFDKHIFDQATSYKTSPKKILLNAQPGKSKTAQQNLWTHIFDEVNDRARAEFGLKEEPTIPRLAINFWTKFTVDSYYRDLVPAAESLGIKQLFVDNLNKNDMSEGADKIIGSNMCCGQEYEIAPSLGGTQRVKEFVDRCAESGIVPFSWTNNDQSYASPINHHLGNKHDGWFVRMEDTRLKYGGAYTNVFTILDFKQEGPRKYWVDSLKKTKDETGLSGYLFDSFYNLGFMPLNFANGTPSTQWREICQAFKELQDHDVHFLIESFGPFGQPQHGCPSSYNVENIFASYKIGLGNDYTTIPGAHPVLDTTPKGSDALYYVLAHKTLPGIPVHIDGQRIDKVFGDAHRRALADYNVNHEKMHRRYLQEDGKSVLWHDQDRKRATLWNFAYREIEMSGTVKDLSTGTELPKANKYKLQAWHTYAITGTDLPVAIG